MLKLRKYLLVGHCFCYRSQAYTIAGFLKDAKTVLNSHYLLNYTMMTIWSKDEMIDTIAHSET